MDLLLNKISITTEQFFTPVGLSLQVALVALFLVLILGTLSGYWMAKYTFPFKIVVETILMLPLVLPPTVVGFLLVMALGTNSPIGAVIEFLSGQSIIFTWYAAVAASTIVAFPLMYQAAKVGFSNVDKDVLDQARVDGASERQVFFKITLPLVATAIISGGILSFARALGEFGATLMIAGNIPGRTQTLPTAIYVQMQAGNYNLVWLWVIVIVLISFIMMFIVRKLATKH